MSSVLCAPNVTEELAIYPEVNQTSCSNAYVACQSKSKPRRQRCYKGLVALQVSCHDIEILG